MASRLNDLLSTLESDGQTIKGKDEAIRGLREWLSGGGLVELGDKQLVSLLDRLYGQISRDRSLYRAGKSTNRHAAEIRLSQCADLVLSVITAKVGVLRTKAVKAFVVHLLDTLPLIGEILLKSVATTHLRSLCLIVDHRPHLEHLDVRVWTSLASLCLSSIQAYNNPTKVEVGLLFDVLAAIVAWSGPGLRAHVKGGACYAQRLAELVSATVANELGIQPSVMRLSAALLDRVRYDDRPATKVLVRAILHTLAECLEDRNGKFKTLAIANAHAAKDTFNLLKGESLCPDVAQLVLHQIKAFPPMTPEQVHQFAFSPGDFALASPESSQTEQWKLLEIYGHLPNFDKHYMEVSTATNLQIATAWRADGYDPYEMEDDVFHGDPLVVAWVSMALVRSLQIGPWQTNDKLEGLLARLTQPGLGRPIGYMLVVAYYSGALTDRTISQARRTVMGLLQGLRSWPITGQELKAMQMLFSSLIKTNSVDVPKLYDQLEEWTADHVHLFVFAPEEACCTRDFCDLVFRHRSRLYKTVEWEDEWRKSDISKGTLGVIEVEDDTPVQPPEYGLDRLEEAIGTCTGAMLTSEGLVSVLVLEQHLGRSLRTSEAAQRNWSYDLITIEQWPVVHRQILRHCRGSICREALQGLLVYLTGKLAPSRPAQVDDEFGSALADVDDGQQALRELCSDLTILTSLEPQAVRDLMIRPLYRERLKEQLAEDTSRVRPLLTTIATELLQRYDLEREEATHLLLAETLRCALDLWVPRDAPSATKILGNKMFSWLTTLCFSSEMCTRNVRLALIELCGSVLLRDELHNATAGQAAESTRTLLLKQVSGRDTELIVAAIRGACVLFDKFEVQSHRHIYNDVLERLIAGETDVDAARIRIAAVRELYQRAPSVRPLALLDLFSLCKQADMYEENIMPAKDLADEIEPHLLAILHEWLDRGHAIADLPQTVFKNIAIRQAPLMAAVDKSRAASTATDCAPEVVALELIDSRTTLREALQRHSVTSREDAVIRIAVVMLAALDTGRLDEQLEGASPAAAATYRELIDASSPISATVTVSVPLGATRFLQIWREFAIATDLVFRQLFQNLFDSLSVTAARLVPDVLRKIALAVALMADRPAKGLLAIAILRGVRRLIGKIDDRRFATRLMGVPNFDPRNEVLAWRTLFDVATWVDGQVPPDWLERVRCVSGGAARILRPAEIVSELSKHRDHGLQQALLRFLATQSGTAAVECLGKLDRVDYVSEAWLQCRLVAAQAKAPTHAKKQDADLEAALRRTLCTDDNANTSLIFELIDLGQGVATTTQPSVALLERGERSWPFTSRLFGFTEQVVDYAADRSIRRYSLLLKDSGASRVALPFLAKMAKSKGQVKGGDAAQKFAESVKYFSMLGGEEIDVLITVLDHLRDKQDFWLSVDFSQLASAAARSQGRHTAAGFFRHWAWCLNQHDCLRADAYAIASKLDDVDAIYGLQVDSSLEHALRIAQHEHQPGQISALASATRGGRNLHRDALLDRGVYAMVGAEDVPDEQAYHAARMLAQWDLPLTGQPSFGPPPAELTLYKLMRGFEPAEDATPEVQLKSLDGALLELCKGTLSEPHAKLMLETRAALDPTFIISSTGSTSSDGESQDLIEVLAASQRAALSMPSSRQRVSERLQCFIEKAPLLTVDHLAHLVALASTEQCTAEQSTKRRLLDVALLSSLGDLSTAVATMSDLLKSGSWQPNDKRMAKFQYAMLLHKARMARPETLLSEHLLPIVDHIDTVEAHREFADFCFEQHRLARGDDFDRLSQVRQQWTQELDEHSRVMRSKQNSVSQRALFDAQNKHARLKPLYDEVNAEYSRAVVAQRTYLVRAIKHYLRALECGDAADDRVMRLLPLWLDNLTLSETSETFQKGSERVPSVKFLVIFDQLAARLGAGNDAAQATLRAILERLIIDHPYHTIAGMFALRQASSDASDAANERRSAAAQLLQQVRAKDSKCKRQIDDISAMCQNYNMLAHANLSKRPHDSDNVRHLTSFANQRIFNRTIPQQGLPPLALNIPTRAMGSYKDVPHILSYEDQMAKLGGLSAPLVLTSRLSDGRTFSEIVKGGTDDLRQDMIMQQVFDQVNRILRHDRRARKRDLAIKTYRVVPLSTKGGVIECVTNAQSFQDQLETLHKQYRPGEMSRRQASDQINQVAKSGNEARVEVFRQVLKKVTPAMRFAFCTATPEEWFRRQTRYTRSAAVMSIVGWMTGLGDRHLQNILLDMRSGEVVHIDFGHVFEYSRTLSIPERVPFRLTRDVVDGMGLAGTEGTFRRCAEFALNVLRSNQEIIVDILNVVRADSINVWAHRQASSTGSPLARRGSVASSKDANGDGTDREARDEAARWILTVQRKLNAPINVSAQVNNLVQQATDVKNLALMYCGWSAWL